MAKLSNINGRFAVEDDGAIQFNGQAGTSGYVLESRGASAPPVWTDRDAGNVTGSGTLNKVVRWTATGNTVGDGPITFATNDSTFAGSITANTGSKITSSSADTTFSIETTSGTTIFPILDFVSSHSSVGGQIRQGGTSVITFDKSLNSTFAGTISSGSITSTATISGLTVIARDNLFVDAGQLYIGADNGSTDGSFRQLVGSGAFKLQKRISGTFTNVLDFDSSLNATFAGDVLPTSDAALSLGGSSKRWNFGFFNNTVTITDGNINAGSTFNFNQGANFNAGTVTAPSFKFNENIYKIESTGATRGLYSAQPHGGDYYTQTSTKTGYLKIVLPPTTNVDDMVKFTVDIYLYGIDTELTAHIGGYLTSSLGWGNSAATIISTKTTLNYTVRFGNDGSNYCVYIGEADTTWSYPQVVIRNFFAGYGAVGTDVYLNEWTIDFTTTLGTISETRTNNFPLSSLALFPWTVDGNDIYNANSANVGIGTTTPNRPLTIQSNSGATAVSIYARAQDDYGFIQFFGYNQTTLWSEIAGRPSNLSFYQNSNEVLRLGVSSSFLLSGDLGIGTTDPNVKVRIAGTQGNPATSGSTSTGFLSLYKDGASHGLIMGVQNVSPFGSWIQSQDKTNHATNYNLTLNPNGGNVGVGTIDPSARLNVSGVGQANNPTVAIDVTNSDSFNHGLEIFDGNLTTGETVLMAIGHSGSTKLTAIYGFIRNENSLDQNLATIGFWGADNKFTVSAAGNVGIGTGTTPAGTRLQVVGTGTQANFQSSATYSDILFTNSSTTNFLNFSGATFIVYQGGGSGSNVTMTVDSGGTAKFKADVVAYGSPSDKRLKENIKPIESALDKVSKLQGVTFDWKEQAKDLDKEGNPIDLQQWKHDIGFIAQDVKKIIPELVRENEDGMLSMRHQGIAPILLEAIKELKAEIEELKSNKCNCNK